MGRTDQWADGLSGAGDLDPIILIIGIIIVAVVYLRNERDRKR